MTLASKFKDHFSGHADRYAQYRPRYPDALFECVVQRCRCHQLAWDCATGNGQAARSLAPYFARVVGSDASEQQIASAAPCENVEYRVATAESSGLDDASVDLVTVAQALHWFDIPGFFAEADRVLKKGGVLAVWCYEHCVVDCACDALIRQVFAEVEACWPPERLLVENRYQDIDFPYSARRSSDFELRMTWRVEDMLGYMRTWSATTRYQRQKGADPVAGYEQQLRASWGEGRRIVRWPITLYIGSK